MFVYTKIEENPTKTIVFPDTIRTLKLYTNYPLSLIVLPKNLESLTLGGFFDQDIRNANFPKSLTHLTLGDSFNQDIKDANFPQLTWLKFGWNFNKDIRYASLPESLTHLTLGESFNQNIVDANFPQSLTNIVIGL